MFDIEFYPTPANVIEMMTFGLDLQGKTVLEPSAGSGNIVDYLKNQGANVIACERHPDLQRIVSTKCRLLKSDFFDVKAEEISHIDYIIMNPPFSNADKHIKHAFEIAPVGCQIIALCNANTINNPYTRQRTELCEIIEKNGSWRNIGDVFSDAERSTGVDIGLINIFKPGEGDSEFDGYFFDMNEEQEDTGSGLVQHNQIKEIVDRYVGAVKMFDSVMAANKAINEIIAPISDSLGISFGAKYSDRNRLYTEVTRDVFKKELQKSAWKTFFSWMNMDKYITSGVMSDINKFVEQQQNVPFTMTNLFKVAQIIQGTHSGRMDRVLVEAFDHICSLSADNSEAGKGWKTNSNYKVNRRFIDTYVCEYDNRWPADYTKIRCGHRYEALIDIIKALCYLTGKKYDDVMRMECNNQYGSKFVSQRTLYNFFSENKIPWGEWVEWNEFFRVRGYKKGTMHFEFMDENVWMEFNRRVAKIKGWAIPEKTDKKQKGTERTKSTGVEVFSDSLF